jgi:hypothetical protein
LLLLLLHLLLEHVGKGEQMRNACLLKCTGAKKIGGRLLNMEYQHVSLDLTCPGLVAKSGVFAASHFAAILPAILPGPPVWQKWQNC